MSSHSAFYQKSLNRFHILTDEINSEVFLKTVNMTLVLLTLGTLLMGIFNFVSSPQKGKTKWPSPPRLPIFGSLLHVMDQSFGELSMRWRKIYGPILSLKIGISDEILVVSSANLAKEILIDNGINMGIRNSPWFYSKELRFAEYMTPLMSTSLHVSLQRQLVLNTIRELLAGSLDNSMHRVSKYAMLKIKEGISEAPNETIDIRSIATEYFVTCGLNLSFGLSWNQDYLSRPEVKDFFEAMNGIFEMMNVGIVHTAYTTEAGISLQCSFLFFHQRSCALIPHLKLLHSYYLPWND